MKISFYLKRPKSLDDTTIHTRISYKVAVLKYYIPESINPKFWNGETQRAKHSKDFREYPEFNARIDSIESTIKSVFRRYLNENQNEPPHPEDFKVLLDKEIKQIEPVKDKLYTFFNYYMDLIERTKNGKRLKPKDAKRFSKDTIQIYENTYNRLIQFQKTRSRTIDFSTIDLDFYYDFLQYLTEDLDLSTNTIGKDIKTLKTILNDATERGFNTNLAFKSKKFITPTEESDSIYLNEKELLEMSNLDLSNNSQLENVRYAFLVGCWTGLRYSDFSQLTLDHIKGDYIKIKTQKTNKWLTIPVHVELIKLLKDHDGAFPKPIRNDQINISLKEIGNLIDCLQANEFISITKGGVKIEKCFKKWELLTSHTARRSFATNQYLSGARPLSIMAITGHQTEKSFNVYLKLDGKDHARIMRDGWMDGSEQALNHLV